MLVFLKEMTTKTNLLDVLAVPHLLAPTLQIIAKITSRININSFPEISISLLLRFSPIIWVFSGPWVSLSIRPGISFSISTFAVIYYVKYYKMFPLQGKFRNNELVFLSTLDTPKTERYHQNILYLEKK